MRLKVVLARLIVYARVNDSKKTNHCEFIDSSGVDVWPKEYLSQHLKEEIKSVEHKKGFCMLKLGKVL